MLQQILKDMYIDPDVLDALNEEQKKTLFLKMRQEQVRRWKEREEKLEHEEQRKPKPRPAHSKSVSWLLGRDGDVQVIVIGEVDEFKTSRILYSGFGERKAASFLNHSSDQVSLRSNLRGIISSEPVRPGRENLPPKSSSGIQLNLKENSEELRTLPPPEVSASELKPPSLVENVGDSEEDEDTSESADDSAFLSTICYRPHLMSTPKTVNLLDSFIPQDTMEKTTTLSVTNRLQSNEPPEPRNNRGKDFRVSSAFKRTESMDGEITLGRGRVAELMKTFSVSSDTQTPPRPTKPAIPNKPSHLKLR